MRRFVRTKRRLNYTSAFEVVEGSNAGDVLWNGPVLCDDRLLPGSEGVPARLLQRLLIDVPRVVLFVCVENAGRSLMAEAIFNSAPPDGWTAESAGTEPASRPNPRTGPMLAEIGLEVPSHPPRLLTPESIDRASVRITMGCLDRESCPARLREGELSDWQLPDPSHLDDDGFRRVRDEIRARVEGLKRELTQSEPQ